MRGTDPDVTRRPHSPGTCPQAEPHANPVPQRGLGAPWGHPGSLTSLGPGLVGEPCEPETREKGLRGLVRLAELRGLAGLLELYVPEGPMATAGGKKNKQKKSRNKHVHHSTASPRSERLSRGTPQAVACWWLCHAGQGPSLLTSVLGGVRAAGRVVLPQPLHHVLDPPDLLLDLPVDHFVLQGGKAALREAPSAASPATSPAVSHPSHVPSLLPRPIPGARRGSAETDTEIRLLPGAAGWGRG